MPFNQAAQFQQRLITLSLTNEELVLTEAMAVQALSVLNLPDSTVDGTINGGTTQGGLQSEDIVITPSGEREISAKDNCTLVGIIITSPSAGCTLEVMLLVGSND